MSVQVFRLFTAAYKNPRPARSAWRRTTTEVCFLFPAGAEGGAIKAAFQTATPRGPKD